MINFKKADSILQLPGIQKTNKQTPKGQEKDQYIPCPPGSSWFSVGQDGNDRG